MKILFLAPRFMLPADTGAKIRTWNILKQILRFAEVDLVSFSFDPLDERHAAEIKEKNLNVHLVRAGEPGFVRKAGGVILSSDPYSVTKYKSDSFSETLQRLLKETDYDCVHVDHVHMAHYRHLFNGTPAFLDEHNVEYRILERCAAVDGSLWKRAVYKSQAGKMMRFESQKARETSRCFTVSEDDKELLKDMTEGSVPVDVIANGVDTEYFSPGKAEQQDTVVFTGSMDWLPNDDAAMYFCRDILPLIWQKKPDVRFVVVGKSPSETLLNLAKKEKRIVPTGRVDDVRPYVHESKIFVVPLRIGGGTRLKILEAMSMEKAVVSTTVGAEGVAYKNGSDIAIADRPREFADTVLSLLADDNKRAEMGDAARRLVVSKYDWNVIGERLKTIYEEVASEGRK